MEALVWRTVGGIVPDSWRGTHGPATNQETVPGAALLGGSTLPHATMGCTVLSNPKAELLRAPLPSLPPSTLHAPHLFFYLCVPSGRFMPLKPPPQSTKILLISRRDGPLSRASNPQLVCANLPRPAALAQQESAAPRPEDTGMCVVLFVVGGVVDVSRRGGVDCGGGGGGGLEFVRLPYHLLSPKNFLL